MEICSIKKLVYKRILYKSRTMNLNYIYVLHVEDMFIYLLFHDLCNVNCTHSSYNLAFAYENRKCQPCFYKLLNVKLIAVHWPIYKSDVISKKMLLALTVYLTLYILYLILFITMI